MIGRPARLLWAGIALLFIALLVGSILLTSSAIVAAEAEAERRAESQAAAVLFDRLAPELVSEDILGTDYRELIVAVQDGFLSDDRVARVRIWRPDGDLIFSTVRGDKVSSFVAAADPRIQQAATGETVSTVTDVIVPSQDGLEGSDEQLLETFVPLRLTGDLSVSGVAQIDQRYSDIREEGLSVWRPVQIVLAVLLATAIVLLVVSFRRGHEERAALEAAAPAAVRVGPGDDRALRDARDRAQAAERAAREAETKMSGLEARLREVEKVAAEPSMLGKVEELDIKLRASEAEREQHVGELERLRKTLAEKDAQIAELYQRSARTGDAGEPRVDEEALAEAQRQLADARRQLADAQREAAEASSLSTAAEARSGELEARLRAAEAAAVVAAAGDREAEQRDADLQAALGERDKLRARVGELESALEGSLAALSSRDQELVVARQAVTKDASALEERVQVAELRAVDAQERFLDADARLKHAEAQLEEAESRARAAEEALAAASERVAPAGEARTPASELEVRVAELEGARRNDITELQRAHESLANTQLELTNATRRLKEAEARIREFERERMAGSAPAPGPVPIPDYVTREPDRTEEAGSAGTGREAPEEAPSFASRLSSGAPEEAEATTPPSGPEEPAAPERDEEGLSLRERLARAAAARRRGPLV